MDTQRLILFIVFSFSLLMLWQAWEQKNTPEAQTIGAPTAAQGDVPQAAQQAAAPAKAAPEMSAGLPKGARVRVRTDMVEAEIDANGGDLRGLRLLHYHEPDGKPMAMLDDDRARPYVVQGGLVGEGLPNHKAQFVLPQGPLTLKDGQDKLVVPLVWADAASGVTVVKTYTFHRGDYRIDMEVEVRNGAAQALKPDVYFQLVRHGQAPEGESAMLYTYTGPAFYTERDKYRKLTFSDLEKGKADIPAPADDGWVAMVQHHFVSTLLPASGKPREYYAKALGEDLYSAGYIQGMGEIAPGATGRYAMPLYVGPQEQARLEALAPGLDLVRDYGWLTFLAKPIFWALAKIHALVGNWGWAIILLTLLIKLALYPLSAAGYKSMAKMKKLAPRLQRIKEQHGDNREKLHQAMMEMYKTEKINPLGGCLPILMQIPVFIALYWVLLAAVEMREAPWMFWIHDLSVMDPYYILPVVMGATMLIQTKLNPAPPDPIQAKVMMFMPVVFTVMFLWFPAGLVLYWLVNNVLSILQQWVINKQVEA
jgi:YidC/Oxa1 family membrane protein insertase